MSSKLSTRMVEKVWGMERLPRPFSAPADKRIGEIWFEPPAELPQLLVKYIFASEKLSIQTHPSDQQTQASGLGRQGKEECWFILDAQPGATIAAGFKEPIGADEMRAAALDGSIEDMLVWHEVEAGDFFYIPANTVHAIGGGVSLLEVQQNSDITYRLYDYGRPRELHLDDGIRVAKGEAHPPEHRRRIDMTCSGRLVDGPFFTLDQVVGTPDQDMRGSWDGPCLAFPTSGQVEIGGAVIGTGECGLATSSDALVFDDASTVMIARPLGDQNNHA